MTLLPRFVLGATVLMAAALVIPANSIGSTHSSKATKVPLTKATESVERGEAPRLVRDTRAQHTPSRLAPPARAADGNIYVPRDLRLTPTEDMDDDGFEGISEPPDGVDGTNRATPLHTEVVGANVRANDTSGDPAGITNSEDAIAVNGNQVVAGWNDGKNFGVTPGGSGFGYSSDGGLTFTDGGVPPAVSPALYFGDPSLAVDNAGNFYYSNLYSNDGVHVNCVTVNHGKFTGPSFAFDPPVIVAGPDNVNGLDKEWIGVDRVNGNVYVTYTRFLAAGGNRIEFTRSTDQGVTWSPALVLTSPSVESVQGSRVVVGPTGEIQVIYFVYDNATGNNYMRTLRSVDGGLTWGPEVTLPTGPNGIFSNYGSGSPGFNRARGIGFPSLAIDRSGGPYDGRVYATWEETFNFYFDPLGSGGIFNEVESNDTQATANAVTIGQEIHGTLATTSDLDFYKFNGVAGDRIILYLVPGSPSADGFIRLFSGGTGVANRAMLSYIGFGTGLVVYTLPSSGTYYFRVSLNSNTPGNYIVYTGYHIANAEDVAKDTRDVIVQSSPDGVVWDTRRVVNDDPPRFDNAFPEVAVDALGQVYVDWMDHRGDPLGIGTDVYYARSGNGSASFVSSIKVNDGPPVNWSLVSSNLAPNFGDYWNLTADGCNVYANFADGRQGTPDSWVALINECGVTPTLISLLQSQAQPDHVDLVWYEGVRAAVSATVYRRQENEGWRVVGSIQADGTGKLSFTDTAVRGGARYGYRLGVPTANGTDYQGEVWINVPDGASLAVRTIGNPLNQDVLVAFSLPGHEPATLELLDVAGRSIKKMRVDAGGQARLGGADLKAGVYLVKLTQHGQSVMTRAVVVR
jgi:Bacterial pre-peptidase C-terminal domain